MALTAEQQTQATQLSNGLPWIYPGASDTDFWGQYFSGAGPSLTPEEQASGISIGPVSGPSSPPRSTPTGQGLTSQPQPTTQPGGSGAYQSGLIQSLRAASPGFGSDNPGVTLLENRAGSSKPINFTFSPKTGLTNRPPVLKLPDSNGVVTKPPGGGDGGGGSGGGTGGGGGSGGGITIGPGPADDDVSVPDYTDDLYGPEVPDYTDDLGPPVEDESVQTFPVPDPAPPDVMDLPPIFSEDEVPDYTEDLWPPVEPEPQDPPQGEIEVGPPGNTSNAGAIGRRPVGSVGDPADEWEWIELPEPEIPLPEIPEPSTDYNFFDADLMDFLFGDLGGGGGGASNNFNVISLE